MSEWDDDYEGLEEPMTIDRDPMLLAFDQIKNTDRSWVAQAHCKGMDPQMFFLEHNENGANYVKLKNARIVCGGCPVRQECFKYAMDNWEPAGIWAGTTPMDRRKMRNGGMKYGI